MVTNREVTLSIIIVNYNAPAVLANCLTSIDKHINVDKEVLIIDNDSDEEYLDELHKTYAYLKIIRLPNNTGFGYANNIGVKNARGKIILFLNSDTEIIDNSITNAIVIFSGNREKQLWGFKLLWPDGQFQNSFSREITFVDFILSYTALNRFDNYIERIKYHKYRGEAIQEFSEVAIVYASAFLMWREDFLALNGFDSRYFMYYEDIDLCDRFRHVLGGKIFYYPFVSIIHGVKESSKGNNKINIEQLKSMYRYGFKKFGILKGFLFMIIYVTANLMLRVYRGFLK